MANAPSQSTTNDQAQTHATDVAFETDDSILIRLEVQQASTSAAPPDEISSHVKQLLSARRLKYRDETIPFSAEDDDFLAKHVVAICIVDTEIDQEAAQGTHLLFWQVLSLPNFTILPRQAPETHFQQPAMLMPCKTLQVHLEIHVFQLSDEGTADDDEPEDDVSTYRDWLLPAQEFHNLWDSLIYDGDIKSRLLQYASTVVHAHPFLIAGADCAYNLVPDKVAADLVIELLYFAGYPVWGERSGLPSGLVQSHSPAARAPRHREDQPLQGTCTEAHCAFQSQVCAVPPFLAQHARLIHVAVQIHDLKCSMTL